MNKMVFFPVITILTICINVVLADNPIISHKYTADPNAMVSNGRVYVYCSNDENNNDGYDIIEYTLVSSDDMVNWTDHGEVFNAREDTDWAGLAYAPACIERDGKYYLYFPDGASSIGVAVADRPEGPFTDPLGEPLVSRSTPGVTDEVAWIFDPGVFIDDDGQAYLYFGGGGDYHGENLQGIRLNDDMTSISGSAVTIEARNSFEAAYMHKYDGNYYFSYSDDFSEGSADIAYLMSDDPLTGFEYTGIVLPNPTLDGQNINTNNNNHASIIEFQDNWYIFYHDRRISDDVYKRDVSVDALSYNSDGTMQEVTVTSDGPPQIKNLNPYDTIQAETICSQSGIETGVCSEGGMMVTSISEGDYIKVEGVDFGAAASTFNVRAASGSSGGSIELHLGSREGTLVGTCDIPETGGWDSWETFQCDLTGCSGVDDLYLVFRGSGEPFRLNWYRFSGASGYLLTVNTTGQGTVSRDPEGTSYEEGTSVSLTAEPDQGWEFVSWSGDDISSSESSIDVTMDTDMSVSALFARGSVDGNLVLNGDFSSDTDDWTLNVWEGDASGEVQNGEYVLTIDSVGTDNYQIQLVQPGLFLEQGKQYEVSFDAYAASSRNMEVNVEMAEDPWDSYLPERETFGLTADKQTYSFTFTMEAATDANGRLSFNAGASTENVYIDNVSVKEYTTSVTHSYNRINQDNVMSVSCSNSVLQIEFRALSDNENFLRLYDMKGNLVKRAAVNTSPGNIYTHDFDLSSMSNGVYIVKLGRGGRSTHTSKIMFTK